MTATSARWTTTPFEDTGHSDTYIRPVGIPPDTTFDGYAGLTLHSDFGWTAVVGVTDHHARPSMILPGRVMAGACVVVTIWLDRSSIATDRPDSPPMPAP